MGPWIFYMNWKHKSRKKVITFYSRLARGFSLVELVVVLGIFTLITGLVLANHSRFNGSVLLGSLSYNIALSIREAQVYGLSVKQFNVSQFQVGYGIHFNSGELNSYSLFVDVNTNKRYDSGTDTILKLYTLNNIHHLKRFCGVTVAGVETCSDSGTPIQNLDIVFFRPNPDASISSESVSGYSRGKITVMSDEGVERTVTVATTGQVSVSQ
jgi:prepilin-type N-terminal cleavage/methylation domain-containing protein